MNIKEAIQVHKTLNPLLWNEDMTLKEDVKQKLFEIIDYFQNIAMFKFKLIDAHIVGSNASYNYTEHSDLDLHLIINYADINCSEEVISALCNFQKAAFNNAYDIKIHGINVEIYLEDVNSMTLSNGIYSLFDDEWIKKPVPLTDVPQVDIDKPLRIWKKIILDTLENGKFDEVSNLIDKLYMVRKNSLSVDGEYGKGNQLFKEIRNLGLLDKLKEKQKQLASVDLSLESFMI